jgi:hypothetical protein
MGGTCSMYRADEKRIQILVRKPEGNKQLVRRKHRWEDNIKMDLRKTEYGGVED